MIISLEIPDAQKDRIINAFCAKYDYDTRKAKSETKAHFAKRMLYTIIKNAVISYEVEQATNATRDATIEKGREEIVLD